jgi:hypothetical protein
LWLYKNHYKLRDEPTAQQQRILMQGTDVGLLARKLFGSGVDASPTDVFRYRESVRDTAKYIAAGHTVIFEAAFQYEGVLCAVDILLQHKGKWYAYEVKSSTGLKEQFIQDAALQYHVITNAGLELEDIFIVHINTGYVRKGDLQLKQLFIKHSVKDQVIIMQPFIAARSAELKLVTIQKQLPNIEIGPQCTIPYTCDFYGFCHQEKQMFQDNIPNVLKTEDEDGDEKVIFLGRPVHFLHIGAYRVAVPEYDGHWPYRHIPFQYSMITINNEEQIEDHFIAQNNSDPIVQFVENFKSVAKTEGQIFVSGLRFVQMWLTELQKGFPIFSDELCNIKSRLVGIEKDNYNRLQPIEDQAGGDVNNVIANDDDAAAFWYNQSNHAMHYDRSVEQPLRHYAVNRLNLLMKMVHLTG